MGEDKQGKEKTKKVKKMEKREGGKVDKEKRAKKRQKSKEVGKQEARLQPTLVQCFTLPPLRQSATDRHISGFRGRCWEHLGLSDPGTQDQLQHPPPRQESGPKPLFLPELPVCDRIFVESKGLHCHLPETPFLVPLLQGTGSHLKLPPRQLHHASILSKR